MDKQKKGQMEQSYIDESEKNFRKKMSLLNQNLSVTIKTLTGDKDQLMKEVFDNVQIQMNKVS